MIKTKNNALHLVILILLLSLIASVVPMASLPQASAAGYTNLHTYETSGSILLPAGVTPDITVETDAHLSFRPNPIGVNQPLLMNFWVSPNLGGFQHLNDYVITLTKPDGTVVTLESYPPASDSTDWEEYKVDKIGTWTVKFDFLGGYFPAGNYTYYIGTVVGMGTVINCQQSVYYTPCSDGPYDLVVQEQQVESWPESSLPTDYWSFPISPENREWWSIGGWYPATGVVGQAGNNWPADTNTYMSNYGYTPYTTAPESAHILWSRQGVTGGIAGGALGDLTWNNGGGNPSILYNGRAYQSVTKSVNGISTTYWQCYDIQTGEIYWEQPVGAGTGIPAVPTQVLYEAGWTGGEAGSPAISASQGSGKGIFAFTISNGLYTKYNLYTGATVASWTNISIAPLTTGTLYKITDYPYFLSVQNVGTASNPSYRLINWTVRGDYIDTTKLSNISMRVLNNVTWPFSSLGVIDYESGIACVTLSVTPDSIKVPQEFYIQTADIRTGQLLVNVSSGLGRQTMPSSAVADHGKFAVKVDDGLYHCWDLSTGKYLWTSEQTTWPWGWFSEYGVTSYGGMLITNQYDGINAIDWDTGKTVWFFQANATYPYETPYQDAYPFFTANVFIADGKYYVQSTEHTPTSPITRGWCTYCLDIYTGTMIWNITGCMAPGGANGGYMTASCSYDGKTYVFGKGQTTTTVSVKQDVITEGSSVLITGAVMDQSPGQPDTPAISDFWMTSWMEYLHLQREKPTNATGVPVHLQAIALDGAVIEIGSVTSDINGCYELLWTPPSPNTYKIIASFDGTNSYWKSSGETAIGVVAAPSATPAVTASPTSTAQTQATVSPSSSSGTTFALSTEVTAAIVVVVIIVVVAAVLLVRRRKGSAK